jgi:virginiamycin B lyase
MLLAATLASCATTPASPPADSRATLTETARAVFPAGASVVAEIETGLREVRWLAADSTAVWVNAERELIRVDPATEAIVARVTTPLITYGYLSLGEGGVWQASFDEDVVIRIDPRTNQVVTTIGVGNSPEGVGTTPAAVWVANHNDGTVSRIDPSTNTVVATIEVGPRGANGPLEIAAGTAGVWINVPNSRHVVHLDPETGRVLGAVEVIGKPAVDGDSVWIVDDASLAVVHVDPATNAILGTVNLAVSKGTRLGGFAAGLRSVWVSTDDGLFRIDQATSAVVGLLPVPRGDVAVGADAVWLVPYSAASLIKIAPN